MRFCVYLSIFSLILSNVSGEIPSPSFCLCALRNLLEDYAMFTTTRVPPRYRPSSRSDVGFYVASLSSSSWKPVNNATWMDLSSMINAPSGMYTRISLDGIDSVNNGLSLSGLRSAYLAEIIASYRAIIGQVNRFHENILKSRTEICLLETEGETSRVEPLIRNKWQKYFWDRLSRETLVYLFVYLILSVWSFWCQVIEMSAFYVSI